MGAGVAPPGVRPPRAKAGPPPAPPNPPPRPHGGVVKKCL
ncbi:hypothetical protein ACVWY1_000001, partial [Pseudomonas sp. TE6288]